MMIAVIKIIMMIKYNYTYKKNYDKLTNDFISIMLWNKNLEHV